ncbi:helix-turn-helix transcriptional regulator [Candidatus Gracilibacteria bacterium]|nr:helix-turn-helix transcriptional regulator [Candidatus Gracilibacteria bacterium]
MENLPHFDQEGHLAARLQSPQSLEKYEKILIGAQVKKMRLRKGLNQKQLAHKLKTTQSVIARIETGKQNLTLRTLCGLSYIFGKRLMIGFRN